MSRLDRAMGALNRASVAAASLAVVLMLGAVLQDVVRRAIGVSPSLWGLDLARYMLTWAFFLGLGPALASGHHVAVDIFDRLWPGPLRRAMPVLAALMTLAFAVLLLWFVWRLVGRTFASDPLAPTVIPVPLKWIQVVGPIGCVVFALNALWLTLRTLRGEATAPAGEH